MMKQVTIQNIEKDSRSDFPFSEGETVTLKDKPALGASLRSGEEFVVGKLWSDGETFVTEVGIRTVTVTVA